jgi:hypothetical protein
MSASAAQFLETITQAALDAGDSLSPGVYMVIKLPGPKVVGSSNTATDGATMGEALKAAMSVLQAAHIALVTP